VVHTTANDEAEMQRVLPPNSHRQKRRSGFTIMELMVTIAVIGLFLGLLLPSIQNAREAARDMQCRNNLKQVGLALHSFHDMHGELPIGWDRESSGATAFGWASQTLAQLGQSVLQDQINFDDYVSSATNDRVRRQTIPLLLCPSDNATISFSLYPETEPALNADAETTSHTPVQLPASNYVGVFGTFDPDVFPNEPGDGAFMQDRALRFTDFVRGQSNTLVVGERTARKLPSTWLGIVMSGEDAPARVTGFVSRGPNHPDSDECEFDSRHFNHVNFLYADGHVSVVHDDIDHNVYQQMGKRQ